MPKILTVLTLTLIVAGCSSQLEKRSESSADDFGTKDYVDSLVSKITPKWYSNSGQFNLADAMGGIKPHMFYDVDPDISYKNATLNFVALTPQNYPTEQKIDLSSGQIHLAKRFCSQEDAWKEYKSLVKLPPYTAGFVPRILDQINMPQKIIVFGQDAYYQKHFLTNQFDARVVGGYIEQICPNRGCTDPKSWLSRLVLVGVQRGNSDYKEVKNLNDLKKKVDWMYVKAFVGNSSGKNRIAGKFYPAYRMGAEISTSQALAFLEKNSKFFSEKELSKMKTGCHTLYDIVWEDLTDPKEERAKLSFDKRFQENLKKYGSEFVTCSKYVYKTSINQDAQRHWAMAFIEAYYRLDEMGFYYDCQRNGWSTNPVGSDGKRIYDHTEKFRFCNEGSIDEAMATIIRFVEIINRSDREGFRYIAYDGGSLGTHNKIYSWVDMDNKVLECTKDENGDHFKDKLSTFPKDMRWKNPVKKNLGEKK